eukprot:1515036-Rhodomonas_salina.1
MEPRRADLAGAAPHGPHAQGTRQLCPPNLLDDGRNVMLRRARGLAGAAQFDHLGLVPRDQYVALGVTYG